MNLDVAIAGFGDAYEQAEGTQPPIELSVEAIRKAVADAGIDHQDIDAIFTGRRPHGNSRPQWNNILADYLNIRPSMSTQVTAHGAGPGSTFMYAAAAINGGFADTVLCTVGDSRGFVTDSVQEAAELDSDPEFESPYNRFIPGIYAMAAQRYLHEFDASKEHMAKVAVEARKWGSRHPEAHTYEWDEISIDDVLSSRPISDPLNLFDCAIWRKRGNGAAFIITAADRAEELQENPIYVRGVGEHDTHEYITSKVAYRGEKDEDSRLTTSGAAEASDQAYELAGLEPSDIDVVNGHCNFTHVGLMELEDLGFCKKGEAGKFVESGGIDFDGGLAYNTNGGCLSFGQPGVSMDPLVETTRQLRGEALGVQVADATNGIAAKKGGMLACNSVMVLSNERGAQ